MAQLLFKYHTPTHFGDLLMRSDGEALTGLWFEDSHSEGKHKRDNVAEIQSIASLTPVLQDTCRWLNLYFSGQQPDFTPKYHIENLTPFRKEVLELMCQIPFGKTVTYGEIASAVAKTHGIKKMSAQAVGGAVGWNPICIIIPCHRVIGANGSLTGYGGGLDNKIALLQLEGHHLSKTNLIQ